MVLVEWILFDVKALLVCAFQRIDNLWMVPEPRLISQPFDSRPRGFDRAIHADQFHVVLATGKDVQVLKYEYRFHDFGDPLGRNELLLWQVPISLSSKRGVWRTTMRLNLTARTIRF